ncbi:MAG: hypothetical protein A2V67_11130 [Deltaproteobacteria bacterium RBG_13_61_14]|nr:MAG: hypothetical protein A2V67_11130 [Deltaproteobacteria bacterium RBG_13_61_14]
MDKETLLKQDLRHLIHPMTHLREHAAHGPKIVVSGQGAVLRDLDGREILDGFSGLWCVVVGHGRQEIIQAVKKQMETIAYATSFFGLGNVPSVELAARLAGMFPPEYGLNRVLFCCGGSEANETNFKFARLYFALQGRQEKNKIISRNWSYHGLSYGALAATGIVPFHWNYDPIPEGFEKVVAPYCYQCDLELEYPACQVACAKAVEELIEELGPETVAAVVAEPVIGSGGIIPPPKEYFPRLREICDRHQVLLILDEVITGFGRTGKMFAFQHWGVRPDMLTLAKGITSGYIPLGAAVVSDRIYDTIAENLPEQLPLMHGFTYMNHPVGCAAAMANLDIIEKENLPEKAAEKGRYLLDKLEKLRKFDSVGDVRGLGLMAAVEFVKDKKTKAPFEPPHGAPTTVCELAWKRGVYMRPTMEVVGLAPPLSVTQKQLDQMVKVLEEAIPLMEKQLS